MPRSRRRGQRGTGWCCSTRRRCCCLPFRYNYPPRPTDRGPTTATAAAAAAAAAAATAAARPAIAVVAVAVAAVVVVAVAAAEEIVERVFLALGGLRRRILILRHVLRLRQRRVLHS